jgi:hypothetical protein
MKEVTIKLYEYSELSEKAKQKALDKHRQEHDDPYMQSHMINMLKEKLDERGIKYDTDSIDVQYSLSSCQGDGFMFEGTFYAPDYYTTTIKHSGHYYHKYSTSVQMTDEEGEYADEITEEEFMKVYRDICDEMEKLGYQEIEYQGSEEYFMEMCDANEYMFEEDGTIRKV